MKYNIIAEESKAISRHTIIKRKMEKHIMNMLRLKKKVNSAGFTAILLAVIIFIACLTTACQPTPEENYIQGKNGESLNEIISQQTSTDTYEFPTDIITNIQLSNLTVNINATIISQGSEYPVAYASANQITQEQAYLILNALIGDAQLTGLREQDEAVMHSKESIIAQLGTAKQQLAEETDDNSKESLEALIKQLESMLDSAPDEIENVYISREFVRPSGDETTTVLDDEQRAVLSEEEIKVIEEEIENEKTYNDFQVIEGICDLGKDIPASISIYKDDNQVNSHVHFYNLSSNSTIIGGPELVQELEQGADIQSLETTYGAAYQQAIDILTEMQIENYDLIQSVAVPLGNPQQKVNDYNACYEFIFSQPIEGIELNYALASGNSEQYLEVWPQEYVKIYIDDTGIIGFYWDSPSEVGEVVNPNVELKTIDEIIEIFKQQMTNKFAYIDDSTIVNIEINIDEIKLGMMKIKEQSTGRYIYVPVWDFYGYSNNTYDSSSQYILDEESKYEIDEFGYSYLTINAIDGSIIDRSLGY